MPSTQFIHVAEFFQTIFCFLILVLIGQRFVRIWKNLDQKYLQTRIKEHEKESKWQLRQNHNVSFPQGQNDIEKIESQNQSKNQQQEKSNQQPPKQETLRASLIENEHEQTDQKNLQLEQQEVKEYRRKSLTDLRKEQQRNSKQIQISNASSSRKQSLDLSINNQGMKDGQTNQMAKKKSEGLERFKIQDLNNQEPSITSNYSNPEGSHRTEIKNDFKIQVITQIDAIFNQHIPILISMLILGILVHSTYIFTIFCFFGYIFSHLILKNLVSPSSQSSESSNQIFLSKMGLIVPKLWIVALFISYWSDNQFS